MANKTAAARRALWMSRYEDTLSQRDDYQAGRICWDTATHLFLSGKDPKVAAQNCTHPYKYEGAR